MDLVADKSLSPLEIRWLRELENGNSVVAEVFVPRPIWRNLCSSLMRPLPATL